MSSVLSPAGPGKPMASDVRGLVVTQASSRPLEWQTLIDYKGLTSVTGSWITFSQLKHSNVRTSKSNRAELIRESIIGARQFAQGRISILSDVKQKSDSGADILLSFDQSELLKAVHIGLGWRIQNAPGTWA
jgi:hypothetical protein